MSPMGTSDRAAHPAIMQRIKIAALRYSALHTRLEISALACVVFSTLIAVALGIHFSTLS